MDDQIPFIIEKCWFKVTGMFRHAWAYIHQDFDAKYIIYFFTQQSEIYDQLAFNHFDEAKSGLLRNGFKLYIEDEEFKEWWPSPPESPLVFNDRFIKPDYSSGEYWSGE